MTADDSDWTMSNMRNQYADSEQPRIYHIRLQGYLGPQWAEWFGGLSITPTENGETLLTGPVADQSALHGVLKKVRDLGLTLVSVNRVDPVPANPSKG
jgi:hypothetical protein